MFKTIFRRIPYLESLRAFLEQWGIWQAIFGSVMALLFASWSMLESHLPYWGIGLVAIAVFTLLVIAAERAHALVVRQRARTIDVPKQVEWMLEAAREMRLTLSDLRPGDAPISRQLGESEEDFHVRGYTERWARKSQMAERFYLKHGGQVIAAFRLISTVSGQAVPFHTRNSLGRDPSNAVAYIEAAAHLMASGNLEELRKMDDSFMWNLGPH